MSESNRLREEILALTRHYYEATWGQAAEFAPGQSRVPYGGRVFDEAELVDLVDSSLDFWLTYGRYSERFERELGEYIGARHCLLVNSGSSANLLAFMALTSDRLDGRKIARGDEVITLACGFPTTVAPIVQYGAVPVFVDVELETANLDVSQLEAAVGPRTKAVMIAHTLGNPFDVDSVTAFCREHGLWLVEDNCDALGSRYAGRLTGTFGDIATSSFYPAHHMTLGEGGAVYTSDDTLAEILASLRDWGRDCQCRSGEDNRCGHRFNHDLGALPHGYDHKYVYSEFGYNLNVTDMQAAVGCAQLAKLPAFVEARRENHSTLSRLIAPVADRLVLPQATPGSDPSWFGFLITVRPEAKAAGLSRDALVRRLEAAKIQTRMLFAGNMVRQPCFDGTRSRGVGYRGVGDLSNTDRIMNDSFWIGVYPGLSEEMLTYMAYEIGLACE